MKIPEGMSEIIKEHYIYKDILTLIKSIHSLLQAACFWFKECIKTMAHKSGFKK